MLLAEVLLWTLCVGMGSRGGVRLMRRRRSSTSHVQEARVSGPPPHWMNGTARGNVPRKFLAATGVYVFLGNCFHGSWIGRKRCRGCPD